MQNVSSGRRLVAIVVKRLGETLKERKFRGGTAILIYDIRTQKALVLVPMNVTAETTRVQVEPSDYIISLY